MGVETEQPRIGYLPAYVPYYESICETFGQEKIEVAKRCAETLKGHGTLIWNERLIGDVETAQAAGAWIAERQPDCVVVLPTIAVFGGIPWAALERLEIPILIWNAQQIKGAGSGYNMVEIVRNTGQIGAQALANTLVRAGRWFRVVTGHEKSKRTGEALNRFFRTIATVRAVRCARLLRVGGAFPGMSDIEVDPADLKHYLGATVIESDATELTTAFINVPDATVRDHLRQLRRRCEVKGLTADEAQRSARLCEAIQQLAEKHEADAGSVNCHLENCLRNPDIGVTACYALGVQNGRGRPFTCTGDLPTALAMLILKRLSGSAMYTEVQVMDERRRALVIANSGEGEEALRHPDATPAVRGNANFAGLYGRGASFVYPLRPGPATIASLTPTPGGKKPYRLIAAEGEILPDKLPDVGALAGFFRFSHADLHTGYTRWLEAGPVHHAGTAAGHWANELRNVAELLNMEFIGV